MKVYSHFCANKFRKSKLSDRLFQCAINNLRSYSPQGGAPLTLRYPMQLSGKKVKKATTGPVHSRQIVSFLVLQALVYRMSLYFSQPGVGPAGKDHICGCEVLAIYLSICLKMVSRISGEIQKPGIC